MLTQKSIESDVKWAIGDHRILLQLNGLWIFEEGNLWMNTVMKARTLCLLFCIFGFITFPQTAALLRVWGDVTLIGDNIMANLPVTMAGIKLLKLWANKKVIVTMIGKMEEDWYQLKNDDERKVMMKYARIPKIMLTCGLINSALTSFIYHGLNAFFGITLRSESNKTDMNFGNYTISLQTFYFFSVSTTYCYYMIIISQFIGTFVAGFVYASFDVTFGLLVLHVCAQLENLTERIQNMSTSSRSNFMKDLKLNVLQHCRLIGFIGQIEGLFSTLLAGIVVSFAALFSVLGFQLVTSFTDKSVNLPILQVGFYILHMNYFLCLMFLYSWVGEVLMNKSEDMNFAVFCSNWTSLAVNDRILILMLFVRIQKTLCITIGGIVPLSLDSFTQLMKTSMGYISVLLAIKE